MRIFMLIVLENVIQDGYDLEDSIPVDEFKKRSFDGGVFG